MIELFDFPIEIREDLMVRAWKFIHTGEQLAHSSVWNKLHCGLRYYVIPEESVMFRSFELIYILFF